MCTDFWIMISAIATALMAIATFITIAITLRQNREDVRARLLFSIVRKDEAVFLKISNVGNSVATDIHIQFSESFKDMLLANGLRDKFESLEKIPFSIDAKDSKYYKIIPAMDNNDGYYTYGDTEGFTQTEINEWHKKHDRTEFVVSGFYNNSFKFKEHMSIYSFLNVGAVEINEVASVLRRQNELLKKIDKSLQLLRVSM